MLVQSYVKSVGEYYTLAEYAVRIARPPSD